MHTLAVYRDRARAARALIAAFLGADQVEVLAQRIEQGHTAVKLQLPRSPVDAQHHADIRGA